MSNIKILISYHDEHPKIESAILKPIQTGCANAFKLFKGMLRDNDGENISAENDRYNELSAQYWAWKNYDKIGQPDFVGFMHYRRHFIFDGWRGNPDWCWLPNSNVYFVPYMTEKYKQHIADKHIRHVMKTCDCLVIKPYDVRHLDSKNIRTQFCKLPKQQAEIFDVFIKTAKKLYPDYMEEIERIEKGSVQYLCNMFVMRKDLFFEYSQFCFDVLEAIDKQVDSKNMDAVAARFLGFLGEFLLSIFVFRLQKNKSVKICEVEASFILSDDKPAETGIKYLKYLLLSKVTFGKRRRRYKQKRKMLKNIRKELKKLDVL